MSAPSWMFAAGLVAATGFDIMAYGSFHGAQYSVSGRGNTTTGAIIYTNCPGLTVPCSSNLGDGDSWSLALLCASVVIFVFGVAAAYKMAAGHVYESSVVYSVLNVTLCFVTGAIFAGGFSTFDAIQSNTIEDVNAGRAPYSGKTAANTVQPPTWATIYESNSSMIAALFFVVMALASFFFQFLRYALKISVTTWFGEASTYDAVGTLSTLTFTTMAIFCVNYTLMNAAFNNTSATQAVQFSGAGVAFITLAFLMWAVAVSVALAQWCMG